MTENRLVNKSELTSYSYNESYNKLVSQLLTNYLTSKTNPYGHKRLVNDINQLLNLTKTDKRAIYLVHELGPIYQQELKQFVSSWEHYCLMKLVGLNILTSKLSDKSAKLSAIKSKMDKTRGVNPQARKYYDFSPEFQGMLENEEVRAFFIGNPDTDFDEDFLGRLCERKEKIDSVLAQIETRERLDEEHKKEAEQEQKGLERKQKRTQERIAGIEKELRKFRIRESAEEFILSKMMTGDREFKVMLKKLWEKTKSRLPPRVTEKEGDSDEGHRT